MKTYIYLLLLFAISLSASLTSFAQDYSIYPSNVRLKTILANAKKKNETTPITTGEFTNTAKTAVKNKQFLLAVDCYSELMKLDPQDHRLPFASGLIKMNDLKDLKGAVKDFTLAIKLDPTVQLAYYNRGTSYLHLKEFKRSIVDLNKSVELNASHPESYLNRGISKLNTNDVDGAMVDFNKGISIKPQLSNFYTARAIAYKMKGNEALAQADEARAAQLK